MKVVLVDDEKLARNTLQTLLQNNFSDIEIVGEAESVKQAISVIEDNGPDLVFLDVDLTDGTGFDVLNSLDEISFKIIFITAHQEYAMKAIKFSAFDYILKPISLSELTSTLDRLLLNIEKKHHQLMVDNLKSNYNNETLSERKIILKTSESIHLIGIVDIIRCEADNNYTTFFVKGSNKIVISKGLREYEDMLSDCGFFRIHQSHLINVNEIKRFDRKDGGFVVLTDNSEIPVSQRKKQKLFELFEKLA